jgi:small-conductance mechanosensitive channel
MQMHVTVGYGSDVAQVQAILCHAALSCDRVLRDPPPSAFLQNFGADGLDFMLAVWIDDPSQGSMGVRSQINLNILADLRAAGIEIPYPQRVVELRTAQAVPRENP